jgi:CheY-like chemotaxis protein
MAKKILIFESDATFADELRQGFTRLGCEVAVVDDATQGLQQATKEKPDIIYLAVELPRSNGFSVCNKLKRDTALAAVPVVILSQDSTDETFEQHRRLRGRAEDYIHKPIAFDALLARTGKFAALDGAAEPSFAAEESGSMASIVDDDDLLIDDLEDAPSEAPSGAVVEEEIVMAPPSIAPVSDGVGSTDIVTLSEPPLEIESVPVPPAPASLSGALEIESLPPSVPPIAAAEQPISEPALELDAEPLAPVSAAPGSMPAEPPAPPPRPASRAPSLPPSAARRPSASPDAMRLHEEIDRLKQRVREVEESERAALARADELDDAVRRGASRDAEVQRLQRELDESKTKLASGKQQGSAREFLDLREQLNKKDKELLDLRDQVTHRDKELLGLKDGLLVLEREKADYADRVAEMEQKVVDAQKREDAAKNDKDQAAKRAEDFRRKADKLKSDVDLLTAEIASDRAGRDAELAERDARETALRADIEEAKRRGEAELEGAVATTEEQGKKLLAEALEKAQAEAAVERQNAVDTARAAVRSEAEQEHEAKVMALSRAQDDALAKVRAEHGQALIDVEAAAARQISEKQSELDTSRREAEERGQRLAQLEGDLAVEQSALAETRNRLGSLEQQLTRMRSELDAASNELESFRDTATQRAKAITKLEQELDQTRATARSAENALGAEKQRVEELQNAARASDQSLERAKDALAATLARIEEAQQHKG